MFVTFKKIAGTSVIYVNANSPNDPGTGTQSDPFRRLQDGIDAAAQSCGGEVWVAAGTYKPTTGTDRGISFVMRQGVYIYGGFTGTETSRDQRNWRINQTILSGDIGTPNDNSDNSYIVIKGASDATLDGFTITGGNDNDEEGGLGGGMYNNGSPTVTNCTFISNSALYGGGGMYNESGNNSPVVTNCKFINNSAVYVDSGGGGGMCNYNSNPTVTNCLFCGNSSDFGGGIYNYSGNVRIINCTLSGNSATISGGGMCNDSSNPTVVNCILWGNTPDEIENSGSTPIITYSDVQGGWSGTGDINDNPHFVNPADCNLHLLPNSPCIDAGNNSAVPPGVTTDLDGFPRIIDGIVDMGAYEYSCSAPTPATNGTPQPNVTTATGGLTTDLSWTAGSGATSYDVYFGTVLPGSPNSAAQTGTTFDTGTMVQGKTYYCRVIAKNACGSAANYDWNFSTECMKSTGQGYANWVTGGRPDCWCYMWQRMGDIDGKDQGSGITLKRIGSVDLSIFQMCFGKKRSQINNTPCMCADLDHLDQGSGITAKAIGSVDLAILSESYGKKSTMLPYPPPYAGDYYYWTVAP